MGRATDATDPKPFADRAARLLRERGLRVTRARRAILATLMREQKAMSHAEMLAAVGGLALDRATVYRVLVGLADHGVLARHDLGDHLWRFAMSDTTGGHDHPHFVCDACQDVTCLEGVVVATRDGHAVPIAIAQGSCTVRLSGICDSCRHHGPPSGTRLTTRQGHKAPRPTPIDKDPT
jgi:Fur family ferric uptake transcriptional regulator